MADGDSRKHPVPVPDQSRRREALVIAAPWLYHPLCGIGGGVVCFELLKRLAESFDVHFTSFDQTPNDSEGGRRALERVCASVTIVASPRPVRGPLAWPVEVMTTTPREARDLSSPAMAATITRLVQAHDPVAVILQFPQMAQYMDAAAGAPVVMDVQDACMVSRYREWRKATGLRRRAKALSSWLAWLRYEHRWYSRADALLAISENDLGVLRSFFPDIPCFYSPVAADPVRGTPGVARSYVAFIGNFWHAPNRDALEWLIREIWPRVRAQVADAELHVAGPAIPDWAGRYVHDGVIVRGFVDSVEAFYAGAQMALVPYRFGGGTKIKALEAMAHGCPVVATTIGSEGLQVTPGVQLRVADDAQGFAEAIIGLMRSAEERQALADAALAHIERHFSWQAKVAALVETLRTAHSRKRKARALA